MTQEELYEEAEKNPSILLGNVYDANSYDSIVETFNPQDARSVDLWGSFEPTRYQYEWHQHFTQRDDNGVFLPRLKGVGVCHRRYGKSVGVLKGLMLPHMIEQRGLYIHAFPSLTQGRAVIWNGLGKTSRDPHEQAINYLEMFPRELWKKKNNHAMTLELYNGSIYQIVGVKGTDGTANHLRGLNPMGLVGDEFGDWHANIVDEIFEPIFKQNGGWVFLVGTPKGENQFFDEYLFAKKKQEEGNKRYRAWFVTIDDSYYNDGTPIISKESVEEDLEKGADPETIQQEYYCSFKASASGAWYRHSMKKIDDEQRITHVSHDSMLPTFTFYDLGGNDEYACVVAQFPTPERINIVDNFVARDIGSGEFLDTILSKYRNIHTHFFPWDGGHKFDFVGTRESRIEKLKKDKGISNIVKVQRNKSVADGVEIGRRVLNKCWIDERNCRQFVNDIRNYKKKKNISTDTFTDSEVHDQHSHNAAAYRVLATAYDRDMIPKLGAMGIKARLKNLAKRTICNIKI